MKKRIMYGSELIGEFPCELDLNKDISSIVYPPIYISVHSNAKKPTFDFQQHDLLGNVGDRRYCYYYDSIYYLLLKHIEGHIEIRGDCVNLFFYGNPPTPDVIWSIIDPFVFSIVFQIRGYLFLHGGAIINKDNEVSLILASPKTGKSTLICDIVKNYENLQVFADDAIVYDGQRLLGGISYFRLWPDTIRNVLNESEKEYKPVHEFIEKRYVPFTTMNGWQERPCGRIKNVFLLDTGSSVSITNTTDYMTLVKHTVNNELIAKKFFHQYIDQLIKLGNSSSIYKIILPHDFDCLHCISSEIAKRSCSPTDI